MIALIRPYSIAAVFLNQPGLWVNGRGKCSVFLLIHATTLFALKTREYSKVENFHKKGTNSMIPTFLPCYFPSKHPVILTFLPAAQRLGHAEVLCCCCCSSSSCSWQDFCCNRETFAFWYIVASFLFGSKFYLHGLLRAIITCKFYL